MELLSFEEVIAQRTGIPCPIKNIFHKSQNGCFLEIDDNGKLFHVFKAINATFAKNGETIYELCQISYSYSIERLVNSENCLFKTSYSNDSIALEDFIQTKDNLLIFLKSHFEHYHNVIQPKLISNGIQYNFMVWNLYDVIIMEENKVIFLRPIFVEKSFQLFIQNQRLAFFKLLQIYSTSIECERVMKGSKQKDRQSCSASSFLDRGLPPEFKCEYNLATACANISSLIIDGKMPLIKPKRLCSHVLDELIRTHGETAVNSLFNFKCQFASHTVSNFDNNNKLNYQGSNNLITKNYPLSLVFEHLFGRSTKVHRLCLPDQFLNKNWYDWMVLKIIKANIFIE